MRLVKLFPVAAMTAVLATGGCLSKPAPSQHLFVLPTAPPSVAGPALGVLDGKVLGIGPIEVASHLDRRVVARRLDLTRYEFADSMRWASPVDALIEDRLVEGLIWATGVKEVRRFPWIDSEAPDVRVGARVVRFELAPEGMADFAAYWSIADGRTGKELASGFFEEQEPVQGPSGAAGVQALDTVFIRFVELLASELAR